MPPAPLRIFPPLEPAAWRVASSRAAVFARERRRAAGSCWRRPCTWWAATRARTSGSRASRPPGGKSGRGKAPHESMRAIFFFKRAPREIFVRDWMGHVSHVLKTAFWVDVLVPGFDCDSCWGGGHRLKQRSYPKVCLFGGRGKQGVPKVFCFCGVGAKTCSGERVYRKPCPSGLSAAPAPSKLGEPIPPKAIPSYVVQRSKEAD